MKNNGMAKYTKAMELFQLIVYGIGQIAEGAEEAVGFWTGPGKGHKWPPSDLYNYSIDEQAAFWEGYAYKIADIAGYGAAELAKQLTEEQLNAITEIIHN